MSCHSCEKAEEKNHGIYYRWNTSRIKILGCLQHCEEVRQALNSWQKEQASCPPMPECKTPKENDDLHLKVQVLEARINAIQAHLDDDETYRMEQNERRQ